MKKSSRIPPVAQRETNSLGSEEIESRFGFHKATIEGPQASTLVHQGLRNMFREVAEDLDNLLDNTREKALAFTALEEASMWAHKAIAKNDEIVKE